MVCQTYDGAMDAEFEVARRVSVAPERLAGWVQRFGVRHGQLDARVRPEAVTLRAADGAHARLGNLWEPLPADLELADALTHLAEARVFALLLVRKGASAVAIADGDELIAHRVSRHYVQARTKAGGWSQQRYARRRDNQARGAYQRAADDAFEVLVPRLAELSALVTGGDRPGLAQVLADARLVGLAALPQRHPELPVPDARLTVAQDAARQARAIPIELDAQAIAPSQDQTR